MFKWIKRRRQRKYLQEAILFLLRNRQFMPHPHFMQRLEDYDRTVFKPILDKLQNRVHRIVRYNYSRTRDLTRALKIARQEFLEAVKYAL